MSCLLLRNVRPMGRAPVDVRVKDGVIAEIATNIAADTDTAIEDGMGHLLVPGFVDANMHLDKTFWGLPWRDHQAGPLTIDRIENERRLRREIDHSPGEQAIKLMRQAISKGTTHIRTHVDIDTEIGLANLEGLMAAREKMKDHMTLQLVAFPQSGLLVKPGTEEMMEEALKAGADVVGGIDPSVIDRDPASSIDSIFALAERHGAGIDIHLHELGTLGGFSIELIADRTRALGLQGNVTISHAYCLGTLDQPYLEKLTGLLIDNRISIMSHTPGYLPFPPIKQLCEAGVVFCSGSDGIRDAWYPFGNADMLERAMLISFRSNFRRNSDICLALDMTTFGGAAVMGADDYGLDVGHRADFVVVPGENLAEAVINRAPRPLVVKGGVAVARDGVCLI